MDKKLRAILGNSTSGSTEILLRLNSYLSENARSCDELNVLIPLIESKLRGFAAIESYLNKIHTFANENNFEEFLNFTGQFSSEYLHKYFQLYKNTKPYLNKVSLAITISNSNTLLEVFKLWKTDCKQLTVTVTVSSPNNEGKIFAGNLLKNEINVCLITDAMAGIFVQRSDVVIIGADKILKNGSVVNKTGSSLLALAAKYYGKPFYVIATKDKFVDSERYQTEKYPPKEIWDYKHPNLEVVNYYFELIDSKLITRIITD